MDITFDSELTTQLLETSLYVIVFLVASGGSIYAAYRRKNRTVRFKNSPILLAYYTENALTLTKISDGTQKDYSYAIYSSFALENSVIIEIKLPFKTNVHLLAITTREDSSQIRTDVGNSVMERVSLEGDYDAFFKLYADKDMQSRARYVLDPKAMAYTIDFCKSHSWEIIGSELYFVQENVPNLEGDTTPLWDDVERFVEEIRPAVEVPLSELDRRLRTAYGEPVKNQKDIVCPTCQQTLEETSNDVFECKNGHGILLHGSDLDELRAGKLRTKYQLHKALNTEGEISCPSCGNMMSKVDYAGSGIHIDACQSCIFRWIDAGEISKSIASF